MVLPCISQTFLCESLLSIFPSGSKNWGATYSLDPPLTLASNHTASCVSVPTTSGASRSLKLYTAHPGCCCSLLTAPPRLTAQQEGCFHSPTHLQSQSLMPRSKCLRGEYMSVNPQGAERVAWGTSGRPPSSLTFPRRHRVQ